MQINTPDTAPKYDAGELRTGTLNSKALLKGEEGSISNYRFSYEVAGGDTWATPRHRHNFDQVRLQLTGSFTYAKGKALDAGWVGYFPELQYYGPQVRAPHSVTVAIQFGGPSGLGFMSPEERRRGYDALAAKGTFENGAYNWKDEKGKMHRMDAYQAVWELIRGRKMEYPKSRYDGLINMDAGIYEWVDDPDHEGVSYKRLGTFTEKSMMICFVKLKAGATLTVGRHTAPEVLFVTSGTVEAQGKTHGLHTAFGIERLEGDIVFKGVKDTELYYIQLPTFDTSRQKEPKRKAA